MKILALKSDYFRHDIVISKGDKFLFNFNIFLEKLGFEEAVIQYVSEDDWHDYGINDINTGVWSFYNENVEIDAVFSKESVTLIIKTQMGKAELMKHIHELIER